MKLVNHIGEMILATYSCLDVCGFMKLACSYYFIMHNKDLALILENLDSFSHVTAKYHMKWFTSYSEH